MMSKVPVLDSTIQKTHEWLKDITDGLGFPNQQSAFAALRATPHTLRDRLPREHAAQLGAAADADPWSLLRGMGSLKGADPNSPPAGILQPGQRRAEGTRRVAGRAAGHADRLRHARQASEPGRKGKDAAHLARGAARAVGQRAEKGAG